METLGAVAPGAMGPWHGFMGAMGVERGRAERGMHWGPLKSFDWVYRPWGPWGSRAMEGGWSGRASGAGGVGGHALQPFKVI